MSAPARESRRLTFVEGTSNKFWEIVLDGSSHTVTFGRIGAAGQTQTKEFADSAAARKSYEKLVGEKLKKGYVDDGAPSASVSNLPPPAVKSATPPSDTASAPTGSKGKAAKSAKITGDDAAPNAKPVADYSAGGAAVAPGGGTTSAVGQVASASVAAAESPSLERRIALEPRDWFLAPYRRLAPLPVVPPSPFDFQKCLKQIKGLKTKDWGYRVEWGQLRLPQSFTREEALFWLVAMTHQGRRQVRTAELAADIEKKCKSYDWTTLGNETVLESITATMTAGGELPAEGIGPLHAVLPAAEFYKFLLAPPKSKQAPWMTVPNRMALHAGFRSNVAPYLDPQEAEAVREKIKKAWGRLKLPTSPLEEIPGECFLAAALGMHAEIKELVASWPDSPKWQDATGDTHFQRAQWIVFGLESAEEIEYQWRRLKMPLEHPFDARGLLACTEYAMLDCIATGAIGKTNKEECAALLEVLALVEAPEAVVPMLQCRTECRDPGISREWLEKNVGHAIRGAIVPAAGKGQLAESAMDCLQTAKMRGFRALIEAAVAESPDRAAAAKIRAELLDKEEKSYAPLGADTPEWLVAALAQAGKPPRKPLPTWATPGMLPLLMIGDKRLNDEQSMTVIQTLAASPLNAPNPLLVAVRTHLDKHVRDAFAWGLFQRWQQDGYDSADKWAMTAIGHLGDDGCVLKITPLIRVWPGESQHARAVLGLECLRAIGSNMALMQLSGIAQKLKFKGLKAKAEQFVEEIAKQKGLTRAELEDRVVPDCGLDERGRREFSFGPRSFSFVLGGDLKPMIRDADGKQRPDLPKPSSKDDATAAEESIAEWKLMKKQIKEVATIQSGRLEAAMVTGRRWKTDDFITLFVHHPLLTLLAQKLIWATFDSAGRRTGTFRVTDERDFATVDEDACDIGGAAQVGVVHALELTDDERAAWGQVLGDYNIVTPFPQLGREIHGLKSGELSKKALSRYKGASLVAPTLVFTLEKLGWIRGAAMDAGCFDEHSKQFPAANVTAVVGYEGTVGMGYIDPNEMLTLQDVVFVQGMRTPSGYGWDQKEVLALSEVHPIVISEVIADMEFLKTKAK